jgi:hypothetical protein
MHTGEKILTARIGHKRVLPFPLAPAPLPSDKKEKESNKEKERITFPTPHPHAPFPSSKKFLLCLVAKLLA